jgi:HK97 family phage prohead protease
MEYKHLKFEIKALNDAGEFEGYAAVKGNVDSYGDVIQNGAFKRTIRNKKNFPILFMHDPSKPVGLSSYMQEDERGLFTRGQLDLSTELGRMVHSGLKMGYIDSMSIGYKVVQDDMDKRGNRLLKEIKLLEYSLITKGFAANELALVSGFKSTHDYDSLSRRLKQLEEKDKGDPPVDLDILVDRIEDLEEEIKSLKEILADSPQGTRPFLMPQDSDDSTLEMKRAVSGAADLPLASRDHEWDGPAAKKRIFDWAGGDDFSPDKAKRAFFYYNPDAPKLKGSYKLPFADVIDGKLVAVPRALSAVQGALDGARGGVDGISAEDKAKIMAKVNAYKKRMGDGDKFDVDVLKALSDLNKFLRGD